MKRKQRKERKTRNQNHHACMRSGRRPSPGGTKLLFAGTISPMICPEGRHDKTRRKAYPYYIMLLGSERHDDDDDDVQMGLCKHVKHCYRSSNIAKNQLRLPSSTWLPAASWWLHALPTQQPNTLPAKERAPMNDWASGGRLYARKIYLYFEPYPWAPSLLARRSSAAYVLVLLASYSTSSGVVCSRVVPFCHRRPHAASIVIYGGT